VPFYGSFEKQFHNATTCYFTQKLMTVASARAIWGEYEIKFYLFTCWKLYSILRTFIPDPKNLFANKLFSFFTATMVWSSFGPYHGMWREYTQTKCIGAILTPWVMTIVLGLGIIMPRIW